MSGFDNFVEIARMEAVRLRQSLKQNPDYRRLLAVQAIIRAYADDQPQAGGKIHSVTARPAKKSKSSEIIQAAQKYLQEKGSRAQTPELLHHLNSVGMTVEGSNPGAVVASYLSSSPLFDNQRGEGYGLKEWSAQQDAADEQTIPNFSDEEWAALADDATELEGVQMKPFSALD